MTKILIEKTTLDTTGQTLKGLVSEFDVQLAIFSKSLSIIPGAWSDSATPIFLEKAKAYHKQLKETRDFMFVCANIFSTEPGAIKAPSDKYAKMARE